MGTTSLSKHILRLSQHPGLGLSPYIPRLSQHITSLSQHIFSLSQHIPRLILSNRITSPSNQSVLTRYGTSIPCARMTTTTAISSPNTGGASRESLVCPLHLTGQHVNLVQSCLTIFQTSLHILHLNLLRSSTPLPTKTCMDMLVVI